MGLVWLTFAIFAGAMLIALVIAAILPKISSSYVTTSYASRLRLVIWGYFTGQDIDGFATSAQNGIPSLITLFAFVIIQGVGLIASEYSRGVRPEFVILFALIGTATVGGIVGINRAHVKDDNGEHMNVHAFSRATVSYGKWVFGLSAAFLLGFVALGASGNLPGQSFKPLRLSSIVECDDDVTGTDEHLIVLYLSLGPENFAREIPRELTLFIRLPDAVRQHWRVEEMQGNRIIDEKQVAVAVDPLVIWGEEDPARAELRRLARDGEYEFLIYLRPKYYLDRQMPDSDKLTNDEIKKMRMDAITELSKDGAIELFWETYR